MATTSKKSRKGIAIALAVLGVAGLSLASAAQLSLTGTNGKIVQSGVTAITAAACQTSTINASFSLDGSTAGQLATGSTFGYPSATDSVTLTSIDTACAGKHFKVAFGTTTNTTVGNEYAPSAVIAAGALTPTIPLSAFGISTVAQINSIAKISVTIVD